MVELNPIARELAQDQGTTAGIVFLVLWNTALLIGLVYYQCQTCLHILFGAKLGLAAMQLKSLQLAEYVEKLLRKPKNVKTNSSN